MTEKADVHVVFSPVKSSWASSRPTATPTSMPRRVSSAPSVRTAGARASGSSTPATCAPCPAWASPNQPPACSASSRMRWRPGAACVTISWAWANRSGSVESAATAASTSSAVKRRSGTAVCDHTCVATAPRLTSLSHGAGCGCKLPAAALAPIVAGLQRPADPRVLVDAATSDDAGVVQVSDELAIVQTADFFTPIVDDPYDFGRIAATNALSDVYAMGAQPLAALNLVAFPLETLGAGVLEAILRGGQDAVGAAGAAVVGGHSIDDPEPKYGLAVTGVVHPDEVLTNAGGRPRDQPGVTQPPGGSGRAAPPQRRLARRGLS